MRGGDLCGVRQLCLLPQLSSNRHIIPPYVLISHLEAFCPSGCNPRDQQQALSSCPHCCPCQKQRAAGARAAKIAFSIPLSPVGVVECRKNHSRASAFSWYKTASATEQSLMGCLFCQTFHLLVHRIIPIGKDLQGHQVQPCAQCTAKSHCPLHQHLPWNCMNIHQITQIRFKNKNEPLMRGSEMTKFKH